MLLQAQRCQSRSRPGPSSHQQLVRRDRLAGLGRAPTRSSISPHRRKIWLLLMLSVPIAFTKSSTDRVEPPRM